MNNCITFWRDGSYRIWGGMDAEYSKTDPDYLTTIPLTEEEIKSLSLLIEDNSTLAP